MPEEEYLLPLDKAEIAQEGKDITLVTFGKPRHMVMDAAAKLAESGIEAEVIDLISLRPIDEETLYASVRKTNRAVVVDEAWPIASVGSHVAHLIGCNCLMIWMRRWNLFRPRMFPCPTTILWSLKFNPPWRRLWLQRSVSCTWNKKARILWLKSYS